MWVLGVVWFWGNLSHMINDKFHSTNPNPKTLALLVRKSFLIKSPGVMKGEAEAIRPDTFPSISFSVSIFLYSLFILLRLYKRAHSSLVQWHRRETVR